MRSPLIPLLVLGACTGSGGTTEAKDSTTSPADTDTDTDADSDTDTDTDTDSDADTDTDTGQAVETAWWVETGNDSNTTTDTDTDTNAGGSGLTGPGGSGLTLGGSGFFRDSGGPGCPPEPNVDTGLPSTRDLSAAADTGTADRDADGYDDTVDCDDLDPYVHPGAPERCDGVDTDCDPLTGEDGLITVDGVDTYTVLADAVRAAAPGATAVLCPGTYDGPIWLRQDLRIIGLEGADVTTIRSTRTGPNLLRVQRGNLMLAGVTVTEADVDGVTVVFPLYGYWPVLKPFWPDGAGLSLGTCGSAVVRRSVFEGNSTYGSGGGIGTAGAPVWLVDTEVRDNVADRRGGGIAAHGPLTLERTRIHGNHAVRSSGGGMLLGLGATCDVDELELEGNVAAGYGGGMHITRATAISGTGLTVHGNTAAVGGGVGVFDADVVLPPAEIYGNEAESGGGAWISTSDVTLDGVLVRDNIADTHGGGAFLSQGSLTGGTFTGNFAPSGGGITTAGGTYPSTLVDVTVRDNSANEGAGLWLSDVCFADGLVVEGNTAAVAGGVHIEPSGLSGLVATNSTVAGNVVDDVWATTTGSSTSFPSPSTFVCNGMGCGERLDPPGVAHELLSTGLSFGVRGPLAAEGPHLVTGTNAGWVETWFDDGSALVPQTLPGGLATSFGEALALDGDTLAVGYPLVPNATGLVVGGVIVYEHDGTTWQQVADVRPPVGQGYMRFGASVALDGDVMVVGAPTEDTAFIDSGAAYVFARDPAGTWSHTATLTASAPEAGGQFGDAVAISGLHAAVAATAAGPALQGQVDRYEDVGGTWTWVDQLLGPHDDARIGLDGLAMDGDLLAIPVSAGTTGSVQVEVHQHDPVLGWQLLWVLDDPAPYPVGVGFPTVDLSGATLVMGVPSSHDYGASVGAVYRYDDVRSGLPPVPLRDPLRTRNLRLGYAVAQDGDEVFAVGDPSQDIHRFRPTTTDPAW